MASSKKLNGIIDYSNFTATLKLNGPTVEYLYGYRSVQPMAFFSGSQLEIFFTSKKPDITAKDFKADTCATIDLEFKIIGKETIEKIKYQLIREVWAIENLQHILGKDHYCYKLTVGHPTAPLCALTHFTQKIYQGTPAEVIKAALLECGLAEAQFDLKNIKSGIVRYYYQDGETWSFICDSILRPNGFTAVLNEANQLVFCENVKAYKPSEYPTYATYQPYTIQTQQNGAPLMPHTGIYGFRSTDFMSSQEGIKVHSSSIELLNNRKHYQGGFAERSPQLSIFHLPGEKTEDNSALAERLHQSRQQPSVYSGEATFPLCLAETLDLEWTSIDKQKHIAAIVLTGFSEIVCSFFSTPTANMRAAFNHSAWTGLPPNTLCYRFTGLLNTQMPRLAYADQQPILLEGIITDASGKLDSKQVSFKENQLHVGLVSLFRQTPTSAFTADQVVLASSCEPFVLQNSAPFANRLVYVWYNPTFGTFTLAGAYRTEAFSDHTILQTVNPNAPKDKPMPSLTIADADQTATLTTAKENSITLSEKILSMKIPDTISAKTDTKKSSLLMDAKGVTVTTEVDLATTAVNTTVTSKKENSITTNTMTQTINGALKITAGETTITPQDFTIKSSGDVTIKGNSITVKATGGLALSGSPINNNK
ncbi:MAG: hypothetical protein EXR81_01565 [Gammaproteobacteria bacterium]|nr:hypothetical protein [Gammaproteobacteria bacterium]